MKTLEILSTGLKFPQKGGKIEFSPEDLGAIAAAFNLAGRPVPFVPGHPEDDEPELGKAIKLAARSGKLLVTQYDDVDPKFAAIVNSGELNRISVKLRLPSHPENKTGTYELRHIGFLGRSQPADEGISEASFSANENEVVLFMAVKETKKEEVKDPKSTAPEIENVELKKEDKSAPIASPAPVDVELAKRVAELELQSAELKHREIVFSKAQEIEPVLQQLVANGQIHADQKAPFVAVFSQLPLDDMQIQFKAGGETQQEKPQDFLLRFLKGLPKQIEYAELAGGPLPRTAETDPAVLAERITAYRDTQRSKGHEVSFTAASSYVRAHPEWKE